MWGEKSQEYLDIKAVSNWVRAKKIFIKLFHRLKKKCEKS